MENVDWRHLTTGSSGLTGQARSQLNRMLERRLRRAKKKKEIVIMRKSIVAYNISIDKPLEKSKYFHRFQIKCLSVISDNCFFKSLFNVNQTGI